MKKYDDILHVKNYIDQLANGINPITGSSTENDTILSNSRIRKCFLDTSEILDLVLSYGGNLSKKSKNKKYDFFLSDEEKSKVEITKESINISTLTDTINEVIDTNYMKKLRASVITAWLQKEGYLKVVENEDGKMFKVVTEKADSIGIFSEPKVSKFGSKYEVNLYTERAQLFIIENIDKILNLR